MDLRYRLTVGITGRWIMVSKLAKSTTFTPTVGQRGGPVPVVTSCSRSSGTTRSPRRERRILIEHSPDHPLLAMEVGVGPRTLGAFVLLSRFVSLLPIALGIPP